jgi:hypothetical protein
MNTLIKHIRVPFRAGAEWILPAFIAAVGIAGLSDDAWIADDSALVDLRALFGAALVTFVIARFHSRMRGFDRPLAADIRPVSRHLSRTVYLVLAFLVVVKELASPGSTHLRDYLGYSLIALLAIRLTAVFYWRRTQRAAR